MTPASLRKKHPRFVYERFDWALEKSGLRLSFSFALEPDMRFQPSVLIRGAKKSQLEKIPAEALDNFVFNVGLAEILSYWKAAVSPVIEIRAGRLAPGQTRFFEKLIKKGLGEFFYKNGINPGKNFVRFASSGPEFGKPPRRAASKKTLLPLGGGKDSLVAAEILKSAGRPFRSMVLGQVPGAYRLAKALGAPEPVAIDRTIDPRLLALNKKGYLNGHTPFSAYLALIGTFAAEIFGFGAVAVGNERSANEPTLTAAGRPVNHQYSKSREFERDFRAYARKYLTPNVSYFSILRPLYEIQIAALAAKRPEALRASSSCNILQKEGKWCGNCAKCLTVFALLYPFAEAKTLALMFGKNLFDDEKLWRFVPALAGGAPKPFECVATKKEMQAAFCLSLLKVKIAGRVPALLRRFERDIAPELPKRGGRAAQLLGSWNGRNFLPRDLAESLENELKSIR